MKIPYPLLAKITLAASSIGSFNYIVPTNQKLYLNEIYFQATGAFTLVGITDGNGQNYGNLTQAAGIPSTILQNTTNANIGWKDLVPDLEIEGGNQIVITLLDTSAAPNVVNLLFNGSKDIP